MNNVENNVQKTEYHARAFVSCSLRNEDKPFVDFVCSILEAYRIQPFGTVGKLYAAPENPVVSMEKNINNADIVVICATPRYIQQDIQIKNNSNGMSEMIHVETGMAIAHDKPIVVFVKDGTNVGNAIPYVTQYVELSGQEDDYKKKKDLVYSLLNNAYMRFRKKYLQRQKESAVVIRDKENTEMWATIGKVAALAIAAYAIIKFLNDNK